MPPQTVAKPWASVSISSWTAPVFGGARVIPTQAVITNRTEVLRTRAFLLLQGAVLLFSVSGRALADVPCLSRGAPAVLSSFWLWWANAAVMSSI